MGKIKQLIEDHPNIWEFIKFNVLSNCATITNFIIVAVYRFIFKSFANTPFKFLVFNYADNIESNLGLCGFLSFLVTAAAQTVNFFVQKNLVFKSNQRLRRLYRNTLYLQLCWCLYLQHFRLTARAFS
ncbi:MAG: hypothetical protein ACLRMZ_11075 [Blautia marasmi]